MSRFALIGTGSVGRVYRPGFSCTNQKEIAPGYISKVMSRTHADEELAIYRHLRLDEVPDAHKYAIFDPIDCPGVKAGKGILNYRDGGETLSVILSGIPSPAELRRLLSSFKTIIAGLTELNWLNRFHMDVKPDNITVDCHGTMRLIDFGWSRYFPNGVAADYTPCGFYNEDYLFWPPEIHLLELNPRVTPYEIYEDYGLPIAPPHSAPSTPSTPSASHETVFKNVDLWALGVTLFYFYRKMATADAGKQALFNLLQRILTYNYTERLSLTELNTVYADFLASL